MTKYAFQSDARFIASVKFVLNSEAGFTDNPKDPGGATMRGIAWNFNADYLRSHFKMEVSDMPSLTADQAKQIYYDRYWVASEADTISCLPLAYIHFDCAVNQGVGKSLQLLNKLSANPKYYEADKGKNAELLSGLILEYISMRLDCYSHDRNRKTFLEGWVNRMVGVINNCKELKNV